MKFGILTWNLDLFLTFVAVRNCSAGAAYIFHISNETLFCLYDLNFCLGNKAYLYGLSVISYPAFHLCGPRFESHLRPDPCFSLSCLHRYLQVSEGSLIWMFKIQRTNYMKLFKLYYRIYAKIVFSFVFMMMLKYVLCSLCVLRTMNNYSHDTHEPDFILPSSQPHLVTLIYWFKQWKSEMDVSEKANRCPWHIQNTSNSDPSREKPKRNRRKAPMYSSLMQN